MELDPDTLQAHEAFINHVVRCGTCFPPTNRYCSAGSVLRVDYDAQHLMTQDIHDRRQALARIELTRPEHCEAMKARMIVLHAQAKEVDSQLL